MDRKTIPFFRYNTIVVGTGAAGYNAALALFKLGQKEIAMVTEGRLMGTSRNTGSDKQTYYKLTLCGQEPDSVGQMAKDLFAGGCVDGDLALAEAAGSLRAFFHLVDIGVPFPFNQSGGYVGYKTDHDPLSRGTSAGPLTSKYMTECLERQVQEKGIPVFDGYQAVRIFTEGEGEKKRARGILALNKRKCGDEGERFAVFAAENVIWATGGEAGMYQSSVYPVSQTGGMGVVLEAGAVAKNLTESQFGIASVKFRWNLSGTFQQCIPRYVSLDDKGEDEREFLREFFDSPEQLVTATFLKGYQWPFDPRKARDFGSSLIDLLVYQETVLRGRRVYLDFTRNPSELEEEGDFSLSHLVGEAREYLENCDALQRTPYLRLKHMNPGAIEVYKSHGIDISREYLEIALCAQHNNGGIGGNQWWESSIPHLFAIGEVNGSHGVYRPGGSALNAGQVGGLRASQYIAANYPGLPPDKEEFMRLHQKEIEEEIRFWEEALSPGGEVIAVKEELLQLRRRMTQYGASIRSGSGLKKAIRENRAQWEALGKCHRLSAPGELKDLYKLRQLLVSQFVYLQAMADYDEKVGISRGSCLVYHSQGTLPNDRLGEEFRNITKETDTATLQEISYDRASVSCRIWWRPVRPVPEENNWFENVWKNYRENAIIR